MQTDDWVFVTGMPRSGTTLAAWLLNLHPDCCILIETGFGTQLLEALQPPVDGEHGYCRAEWYGRTQTAASNWQLGRLYHPQQGKRETPPSATQLARGMCDSLRLFWPSRLLGDKSPTYCFHWQMLRTVFPGCRIVVCDRALDAALASVSRQPWAPAGLDADGLRAWLLGYREAISACPDAFWLPLENLEQDPHKYVRNLLAYVGLPHEPYDMQRAVGQIRDGRVN